jgi:alkylation response protein AidB-like acyl-CoA dehydrogenase
LPEAPGSGLAEFRRLTGAALTGAPADADGRTLWRALGQVGVLAALYQRAFETAKRSEGGTEIPAARGRADTRPAPDRLGALLTELDARYPTGPVLSVSVQTATAWPVLAEGAGSSLVTKVRDGALAGDLVLALAATDAASAGSDLMAAGTTALLSDTEVVVDGGKQWITNACTADYALVLARHRASRHFTSFVWVLVPTAVPGVTASPASRELFGGSGLGHLRFDGVRVGRDHVVGSPGRAMASFSRHISTERLAGGLWARAISRRVLAGTHRRLTGRPLNDKAAWDNDAIRERFARCLVELSRLDASCAQYVASFDGPDVLPAGMLLKAGAAASLQFIVGECVQLSGGDAFADDGLARLSAEVAAWSLAGGATGALLARIADHAAELLAANHE